MVSKGGGMSKSPQKYASKRRAVSIAAAFTYVGAAFRRSNPQAWHLTMEITSIQLSSVWHLGQMSMRRSPVSRSHSYTFSCHGRRWKGSLPSAASRPGAKRRLCGVTQLSGSSRPRQRMPAFSTVQARMSRSSRSKEPSSASRAIALRSTMSAGTLSTFKPCSKSSATET